MLKASSGLRHLLAEGERRHEMGSAPAPCVAGPQRARVVRTERPELAASADHHRVKSASSDVDSHSVPQRHHPSRLEDIRLDFAVPREGTVPPAEKRAVVDNGEGCPRARGDSQTIPALECCDATRAGLQQYTEERGGEGLGPHSAATFAARESRAGLRCGWADLSFSLAVSKSSKVTIAP